MTMDAGKRALLVVSFGTSVSETREKTIDRIEGELAASFPDYRFYRAWTSKTIIKKLFKREGAGIATIEAAMGRMLADGITEVLVQPTYLVNGIENDRMKAEISEYGKDFASISFGDPLLTTIEDQKQAIGAVMEEFHDLAEDTALVFMGHGTVHDANAVYTSLDNMFKHMGYGSVFMGTVEAEPSMDTLLKNLGTLRPKRIVLAPFMVVAGDHAIHDMSGDNEDSWKSRFEAAGFEVSCVMRGLGEYPGIRGRYVEHARAAERCL